MKELFFDPKRHKLPSDWNALSAEQLEYCCLQLHSQMPDLHRKQKLMAALVYYHLPDAGKAVVFADKEDAEQATKFLYGGSKRTKAPRQSIRLGWQWLEGPADKLSTSTFGEFILAEAAFSEWARSGKGQALDRLCAILYRPSKPFWQRLSADFDGDRRIRLNSNMLGDRSKAFAKAEEGFKLAVAAYFVGSLDALASSFPKLFQKAGPKAQPSRAIWMKAAARLADGLPNYDAILKTRLSLALFQLSEMAEEAERIKEATEKMRKK